MLVAKRLSHEYEIEDWQQERENVAGRKKKAVKSKSSVKGKLVIVGTVFLALITGLMLTATQAMINERAGNVIQIKSEISDLHNSNERLKLEIARLKSLDRIEAIALNELGMVQPEEKNIQYIAFEDSTMETPAAVSAAVEPEKGHPAILAINKLVLNYLFGMEHAEASER